MYISMYIHYTEGHSGTHRYIYTAYIQAVLIYTVHMLLMSLSASSYSTAHVSLGLHHDVMPFRLSNQLSLLLGSTSVVFCLHTCLYFTNSGGCLLLNIAKVVIHELHGQLGIRNAAED